MEISDLWPQTLVDLGAMREGSLGEKILRRIEAHLVRRARAVISMLPGVATYLRQRSLPSDHVTVIPNGTDLAGRGEDRPMPTSELAEILTAWHSEGRLVFAYVGSHGRANRLEVVVRAAAILQREMADSIRILILGDGPEKPMLVRLAEELGTTNVYFAAPIPYADLAPVLAKTDVGLIHGTYSPVHRYGTSFNKLYEYWASSRPVVFALKAEPDPVQDADAGLSVAPDDPVALARAIRKMEALPARDRQRMGENGRAHVEARYDLPARVRLFEELLVATVERSRG
jgi:glycosyltransferase involved in cell wall biosynthesis